MAKPRKRLKKPTKDKPTRTSPRKGKGGPKALEIQEGRNTAVALLKDIQEHRLDPRDLDAEQRRSCLILLADGTRTTSTLARIFKVTPHRIQDDLGKIRAEIGKVKRRWGADEVVGQAVMAADRASARALQEGNTGLYWTIQRDLARLMKELGVVERVEEQSGLKITVEALGEGYERVSRRLSEALDPVLTGEVIDQRPRHKTQLRPPALPLERKFASEPTSPPPQVELVVPQEPPLDHFEEWSENPE